MPSCMDVAVTGKVAECTHPPPALLLAMNGDSLALKLSRMSGICRIFSSLTPFENRSLSGAMDADALATLGTIVDRHRCCCCSNNVAQYGPMPYLQ